MRPGVFTVFQIKIMRQQHRIYLGIIIEKAAIVMLWRCIFDVADISVFSNF